MSGYHPAGIISSCVAAVHAGVITYSSGGNVTITLSAGRDSYSSSTANGVTSKSWGSYSGSFTVHPAAVQPAASQSYAGESIPPGFVLIKAGTFQIGGSVELPVHKVQISQSFLISDHEVTVGEYRQFDSQAT